MDSLCKRPPPFFGHQSKMPMGAYTREYSNGIALQGNIHLCCTITLQGNVHLCCDCNSIAKEALQGNNHLCCEGNSIALQSNIQPTPGPSQPILGLATVTSSALVWCTRELSVETTRYASGSLNKGL